MLDLISYQPAYLPMLRELFTENLQSAIELAQAKYSVTMDVPNNIDRVSPPQISLNRSNIIIYARLGKAHASRMNPESIFAGGVGQIQAILNPIFIY
jgi:hypothetical protein